MNEIKEELIIQEKAENPQITELKQNVLYSLDKLNKKTKVYDEMINDYNILYKKYFDIQIAIEIEKNQRINSIATLRKENAKNGEGNFDEDYNFLNDKYQKLKESNEKYLLDLKEKIEELMKLKEKIENQNKKIDAYRAENSALKNQNMILDQKNKELNKINEDNEKKIFKINKACQRMEIDHKKLIEDNIKLHLDLEELSNKLLEIQNKNLGIDIEIISDVNDIRKKSINKNDININTNMTPKNHEFKIPSNLKYKQKIHYKTITSLNFNKSGNKYITTSEDNTLILSDASKNSEIAKFSNFKNIVSSACFDSKEQYIFAGSYDISLKLFNLKDNKVYADFLEHSDEINCVECFKNKDGGLSGSKDKTIKEWDFENNKLKQEFIYGSPCCSLSTAPNDNFILSGHEDGGINLWTGNGYRDNKLFKIHEDKIIDIKIVNEYSFLSLSSDRKIKLFDIRKEKPIYTIRETKLKDICQSNLAINSKKSYFAVGSNEGNLYVINLNNGEIEKTINNNNGRGRVTSLCWRPLNNYIYVGDSNGFISIWGE